MELTWVSGSVKPGLCGQNEPTVMFLTEQGLVQARTASSSLAAFVIQQLLLHPVAAAISPLGFSLASSFSSLALSCNCRSQRGSFTIAQGTRYRGWKGSVCHVHYFQSNCPDWPGHVRCSGAHHLVTAGQLWLFNLLCCIVFEVPWQQGPCCLLHCLPPASNVEYTVSD